MKDDIEDLQNKVKEHAQQIFWLWLIVLMQGMGYILRAGTTIIEWIK